MRENSDGSLYALAILPIALRDPSHPACVGVCATASIFHGHTHTHTHTRGRMDHTQESGDEWVKEEKEKGMEGDGSE